MNNTYISLKRVVEDVISYHPFADYEIDWSKIVNITARTLELFGIPQYYITKSHKITIEDHRGELPENYLYFDLFINCKSNLPLNYTGDESHIRLHDSSCANISCDVQNTANSDTFKGHLPLFTTLRDATYHLNEDYIFTSFQEGSIMVYYQAIPVDDDGYPMIPKDERFIRALEHQIAKQIAYELWVMDKMPDKVYQEIKRNASWAKANAIGEHRIPDKDRLEYWLHSFRLTLIPNIHNHMNRFGFNRQQIVNHGTNNFQQGVRPQ